MKGTIRLAAALLLGGFVLVGCEEAKDTAKDAKDKAGQAATEAKDAVGGAAAAVTDAAANAMETVKKEADELLAKAKQLIGDKKFDDASGIIEKLKALKDKLPADYQSKVDEVVKLFDTAKAAIPALPGGN
jgi:hypothetical protein